MKNVTVMTYIGKILLLICFVLLNSASDVKSDPVGKHQDTKEHADSMKVMSMRVVRRRLCFEISCETIPKMLQLLYCIILFFISS
jgi:hypothetical protein